MYQKIFPANLEFLYQMLEFIKAYGERNQVSSLALDQITLAVEETLVNIMSHGYPNQKEGTIDISCEETTPPGVKIIIKDQGIPFNPIENAPKVPPAPEKLLNEAETSLGGYGIYILIGLMDRVEYQRLEDGGNMLTLIKYKSKT